MTSCETEFFFFFHTCPFNSINPSTPTFTPIFIRHHQTKVLSLNVKLTLCSTFFISGVAERVDYAPGTGPLALFPAAHLETCQSDERCPGVTRIQAAVSLQASRAGSGCDRDTYSLHAQKAMCGKSGALRVVSGT